MKDITRKLREHSDPNKIILTGQEEFFDGRPCVLIAPIFVEDMQAWRSSSCGVSNALDIGHPAPDSLLHEDPTKAQQTVQDIPKLMDKLLDKK